MRERRRFGQALGNQALGCLALGGAALFLLAIAPAHAHHVMGGRTPATLLEGFLSGLGHPVIGIDHLAFIVAVGLVAGLARLQLAAPAVFIAASALGVGLHVGGIDMPAAELVVAASVLLAGALVAIGAAMRLSAWLAVFAIAGLFHGYAYGESIVGAEPAPLSAYLTGLVVVQAALASTIALLARRSGAGALHPRLVGAAIAGIGFAMLFGQIVPV
jgi:urease accessory protein